MNDTTGRVLPDTFDEYYYKVFGLYSEGYIEKLNHHKKMLQDSYFKDHHKQAIRFYCNKLSLPLSYF